MKLTDAIFTQKMASDGKTGGFAKDLVRFAKPYSGDNITVLTVAVRDED